MKGFDSKCVLLNNNFLFLSIGSFLVKIVDLKFVNRVFLLMNYF